MIDHISINVKDLDASKDLYVKMLAPIGYTLISDFAEYGVAGFGQDGKAELWIGKKNDFSGGTHVAFAVESQTDVEVFYGEAIAAGATDNGAPGYRTEYSPGYYAAFVHDLDGNNIEAVWRDSSK